jgi:hypothetical protein
VAKLIAITEKAWHQKELAGALFLDVKGAFDYVDQKQLRKRMLDLRIPKFLVNWTSSFLTERRVQLIIDRYLCETKEIQTGVL